MKEKEKRDKKAEGQIKMEGRETVGTGSETPKVKSEKEKKRKKTKEEKQKSEKEGIKRPLSAYMLYNNHRRPILKKEHPSNFNELKE